MVGIFFHLEGICTTCCNKLLSAPLQDLSQPSLAAKVAFTFSFDPRRVRSAPSAISACNSRGGVLISTRRRRFPCSSITEGCGGSLFQIQEQNRA
jgi:hypothetical protein